MGSYRDDRRLERSRMMIQRGIPTFLAAVGAFSAACGSVHTLVRPSSEDLKAVRTVAVVIRDDARFIVVHESGKDNRAAATGAAFGLLGVLIAGGLSEAHSNATDKATTERLTPLLAGWSARDAFVDAFDAAVRAAGRTADVQVFDRELPAMERKRYDAVATVRLTDWGLKVVTPGQHDLLSGFAYVRAEMARTGDGVTVWDERNLVLGQRRELLGEYERNAELLRNEVRDAVSSAGYQTAVVLLYPRSRR
jgi:hypothetical protein